MIDRCSIFIFGYSGLIDINFYLKYIKILIMYKIVFMLTRSFFFVCLICCILFSFSLYCWLGRGGGLSSVQGAHLLIWGLFLSLALAANLWFSLLRCPSPVRDVASLRSHFRQLVASFGSGWCQRKWRYMLSWHVAALLTALGVWGRLSIALTGGGHSRSSSCYGLMLQMPPPLPCCHILVSGLIRIFLIFINDLLILINDLYQSMSFCHIYFYVSVIDVNIRFILLFIYWPRNIS